MKVMARIFLSHGRYETAQRLARMGQMIFERRGQLEDLPGLAGAWTRSRALRPVPQQSFRDWWRTHTPDVATDGGGPQRLEVKA
jgi:L-lactate dehydrogenase complex protein LldF